MDSCSDCGGDYSSDLGSDVAGDFDIISDADIGDIDDFSEDVCVDIDSDISADFDDSFSGDLDADGDLDIPEDIDSDMFDESLEDISADVSEDFVEDMSADILEDISNDSFDDATADIPLNDDIPEDLEDLVDMDDDPVDVEIQEEVPSLALDDDGEPDWERTSLTESEEALIQELDESGEIDIPEVDEDHADPEHAEIHLPDASGEFLGERGNSEFRPSSEAALEKMSEYGRETVEYKDGYPDFSPFATHQSPWGELDCQVEIGHMTDQRENPTWEFGTRPRGAGHDPSYDLGNFAQADNSLLKKLENTGATVQDIVAFRKDNKLTWHECTDGKTMQLVPTAIHDACRHSGGVSEQKYRMAWGDAELPY